MVLTDEIKKDVYPAASLEGDRTAGANSRINHERKFYRIDDSKVIDEAFIAGWAPEAGTNRDYQNHNGYPYPDNNLYPPNVSPAVTDKSKYVYRVLGYENKTGLESMIKVMAGDVINIMGKSYHRNTTTVSNSNSNLLNLATVVAGMFNIGGSALSGKGFTESIISGQNTGLVPSTFFRGNNNETGTAVPKAYINYLFFDERMVYCGGGFSRVGDAYTVKDHWQSDVSLQNIKVPKNGYMLVYVSNESNFEVFFDNLQILHDHGPLLEETHYYPFGLTMAGISSKAVGKLENKKKFNNGTELTEDFGLNIYETPFRGYDVQIGRFNQPDLLTEAFLGYTPYHYSANNPILFNDPTGLTPGFANDSLGRWHILPPVTVRPSVKNINAKQKHQLWVRSFLWQDGNRVLGNISNFDRETQSFLQSYNRYQNKAGEFDEVYGSVVQEIAITALPFGRIANGIKWMYGAAKGAQMISRLGGRLLAETSKEVLANRGNWNGVDMFDAITNTFLGNRLGIGGKIAVEGLNGLLDINASTVSVYGLQNRFGKSGNQVGMDLMFSGLKIYSGAAFNGVGMTNQQIEGAEVFIDQMKKSITNAAGY